MKAKYDREFQRLKGRYPPDKLLVQLREIERVEQARGDEAPCAAGKEWYDYRYDRHRDCKHEYAKHPSKSIYAPIWKVALDWIGERRRVADFGCGVGQFAQWAIECGKRYVLGIDFSTEAIRKAKKRNPAHRRCFHEADLYESATFKLATFDVAVFLETVEHLADDLVVLEQVAVGKRVVLSVPSFLSYGHCRWFSSGNDVVERYSKVLKLRKQREFVLEDGKKYWLICGVRYANRAGEGVRRNRRV